MDINTLRICVTVLSLIVFVGIMIWVWRNRNTREFKDAANIPFDKQ